MLSRDRLNMDLDKESLHLMLKLNEIDMPRNGEGDADTNTEQEPGANDESSELEKCRKRVQDLLVQLQTETNAKEINLDFVSVSMDWCQRSVSRFCKYSVCFSYMGIAQVSVSLTWKLSCSWQIIYLSSLFTFFF